MQLGPMKERCRVLRNAAPEQWKDFVDMFAEYTAETVDKVSEADAANIMEAKGFALANKAWVKLFADLDKPAPHSAHTPAP